MATILIENVSTIENNGSEKVDIGISDDKILFILDEKPESFIPDKIISGTNKLAVPGFVNTHTHSAMTLFRSFADDMNLMDWLENKIWPAEAKLNSNDVYLGTMLSIAEMLRSGTTTFSDMYFFMEDVARAVDESGIRAVLARGLSGNDESDGASIKENIALFNNWHKKNDGRITVMFGPHAPYTCSKKFIKKVIDAAQKHEAPIHIHLSETKGEVETCLEKQGMTPISYIDSLELFECPTLAAHCVFATEEEMDIMKEKNVSVAHNPQSNLKLASGIAPITKMLDKGIVVGLGTDGASSNNNLDLLEEMRLASLIHKGVTNNPLSIKAREAFDMATINGAKALKLDNIGRLEAGQKADIVLYDMDKPHWYPRYNLCELFVYSAQSSDTDTVIVNGKVLMEKREILTIDEEYIKYEVEKNKKKFL